MKRALVLVAILVGWAGCGGKEAPNREKALQGELARAKTARNQAEAERDRFARELDEADARQRAQVAVAVADADEAKRKLDDLMRELEEFDRKVGVAVTAIDDALTDADRAAAKSRLQQALKEYEELKERVVEARARFARAKRLSGANFSKECMENPLARGCS